MRLRRLTSTIAIIIFQAQIAFSQPTDKSENDTVRVTVSMNADGSRTVYKFDAAQHKALATTMGQDGKVREKIRYELDDAGRYSSGLVFGADGRLRFKSRYKYDSAGRLQEETQAAENDALLHKIVYSYDQEGKQIGYSIFDASGKLIGRTSAPSANPSAKPREKSGQR
jgi:YD repeat-containing protein